MEEIHARIIQPSITFECKQCGNCFRSPDNLRHHAQGQVITFLTKTGIDGQQTFEIIDTVYHLGYHGQTVL